MLSALTVMSCPSHTQAQSPRQRRDVPPPAASRVSSEDAYTLGGGDRIRIDNANLPEYTGEQVIPVDGVLALPLVGSVSVLGLTLEQAAVAINSAYNRILKRPRIGIRLVDPRPIIIVVSGEVNRPGSYTISLIGREPGIRYPTVTQVIQQAEGITQQADISRIQVRRRPRVGLQQVINVNIREFLQRGVGGQDITLRDGDTIFIPTATNVSRTQANRLATTSVAPDLSKPRTVAVLGEVSSPGSYVVIGGATGDARNVGGRPTVTRAIELAGGITTSADIRRIQVRRTPKAGEEQIVNVNLWQFLQAGDTSQDLIVQDGDTIFIPSLTNINRTEINQLATASFAPQITKPRTVSVVGEVSNPGSYVVIGGATGDTRNIGGRPTVTRAIQLAGGVTPASDIRNIQLRRLTKTRGEQIINVNLWQFLQAGDTSQDLILQDGDTIFIPTITEFNRAEANQVATASFATDLTKPRTVVVVGEVNRPGPYVVLGGNTQIDRITAGIPTVTRSIQLAGGITPLADIRRVQLRRPTRAGVEQVINVNLWQLLQSGDSSQDTIVQEGDTIFIPTAIDINTAEVSQLATASFSPNTIQVRVAGEVTKPGTVEVPPNTTLNQALITAGGFNRSRAKRGAVELIRLNSNGTVSRRAVAVDFNQGINEQTNPLLRNNDIIVVGRSGLARFGDTFDAAVGSGGVFSIFRILEILGILQ